MQYHSRLQSRELRQASLLQMLLSRQTDGLTVSATGQRQYANLVHYHPSYNTLHTLKSSDPLLLADGNLHCGMYPTGKVAISRHLVTPGFLLKRNEAKSFSLFLMKVFLASIFHFQNSRCMYSELQSQSVCGEKILGSQNRLTFQILDIARSKPVSVCTKTFTSCFKNLRRIFLTFCKF